MQYIKKTWPTEYETGIQKQFELIKYDSVNSEQLFYKLNLVIHVNDLIKIIQEYLIENIKGSVLPYLNCNNYVIRYDNKLYECIYYQYDNDCTLRQIVIPSLKFSANYLNLINEMCVKIDIQIHTNEEKEKLYDVVNIFDLLLKDLIY